MLKIKPRSALILILDLLPRRRKKTNVKITHIIGTINIPPENHFQSNPLSSLLLSCNQFMKFVNRSEEKMEEKS